MSSAGLSPSRLRHLHDVMSGYVERGEVPGVVTLVSRRGEVHVDCIGYPRDTIFRMASMTKPVTAAGVLVLVEDGVIRLDDPVGRFLPELAEPRVLRAIDAAIDDTVPANRAITVRDLLTSTFGSGFVIAEPGSYPIQEALDKAGFGFAVDKVLVAGDEYMRRLSELPLVHQPGEVWMYNTASDVLGILVGRAAGRPFGEFLAERIFAPLGMRDTGFLVPPEKTARLPTAYIPEGDGLKIIDAAGAESEFSRPQALESGAGGLLSTIDDWFAFVSMLLNHGSLGDTRILSRPAVETMTTDRLTAEVKARTPWQPGWFETRGWGFGVGVVTRRYDIASTPGKYGWEGGYGTSWYNDPREEMVTIAMTQLSMGPQPVVRDFWTLAYAALE